MGRGWTLAWAAVGVLAGAAFAQDESAPTVPVPALQPAAVATPRVERATLAVAVPGEVMELLERYAEAIEAEDFARFETCFWQPEDYLEKLEEVFKHFFNVRLKYLQIEAFPGASTDRLVLRVKVQTRFRENRTKKPGQYDQRVLFQLEQRHGQWRIRSIPDPRSQA